MTRLGALCLLAALGACATGGSDERPPAAAVSLAGRTLNVKAADGQASTLRFDGDGTVRALFGGREAVGRWAVDREQLCFTWAGNFRECWPYSVPLRRGETRTITSSRGNRIVVTAR